MLYLALGTNMGDKVRNLEKAIKEIESCDLLIIGGTSLNVYPAASFIKYFKGKYMVLINRDKTNYDDICDLVINDSLGNIFKVIKKLYPIIRVIFLE